HTAAMSNSASASISATTPLPNAAITPAATPACAAPHVRRACRSPSIAALLTNSVNGFTGTLGCATTTKGACPRRGVASAAAQAVPTGPSFAPSTVLMCAAFGPAPANPSPIRMIAARGSRDPSVPGFLQQVARHRAGLGVVAEQADEPGRVAADRADPVQRV